MSTESDFYRLVVRSLATNISGSITYGTKYNLKSACQKCGTNAELSEPIILPKKISRVKHDIFENLRGETFISLKLYELFSKNNVNSFLNVYSPKNELLPLKLLKGQIILPPFNKISKGIEIENQCSNCKRDGYFDNPEEEFNIIYKNLDMSYLKYNIMETWEHFGNSKLSDPFHKSSFAQPVLIVSNKIRKLLLENKIKKIDFYKVTIV